MVCEIGIAVQSTRGSQLYEGKQNWGKSQPTYHDSVDAYIEDAFAKHLLEFMKLDGTCKHNDTDLRLRKTKIGF